MKDLLESKAAIFASTGSGAAGIMGMLANWNPVIVTVTLIPAFLMSLRFIYRRLKNWRTFLDWWNSDEK